MNGCVRSILGAQCAVSRRRSPFAPRRESLSEANSLCGFDLLPAVFQALRHACILALFLASRHSHHRTDCAGCGWPRPRHFPPACHIEGIHEVLWSLVLAPAGLK
ncbi:hypothetical protein TcG_01477 [Trypanosoma cruzi]|nr:hypothetical protein TcG_01477 [Trypanosoma cruzi]